MRQYAANSQLKMLARERLHGNYVVTITATALYFALVFLASSFINPGSGGILSTVLIQAGQIVVALLSGVLLSGMSYMYLNVIYGKKAAINDLFHGFREGANKAILIQALYVAFSYICDIPFYIYTALMADGFDITAALTQLMENGAVSAELMRYLLFSSVGSVLAFFVTLPLSQSFFLLQDFPDRDVPSIIKASVRLMRGQKIRLVLLSLSFVPMMILSALLCYVPLLFVYVYYRTALAAFYRDLVNAPDEAERPYGNYGYEGDARERY